MLRLRLTRSQVTVFDRQQIVAGHAARGEGPVLHRACARARQHRNIAGLWSRTWFLDQARTHGLARVKVIEQLLDRYQIEAQGYLYCQNMLESSAAGAPSGSRPPAKHC